ncbi:transcription factor MYB77-like [Bidens hawaiensis]|uniref:transcription factor MYB77-like n=1 Tax=Bidens hawaiensis TaxID=980011 RepID=UPI0040499FF7
MAGNGVVRYHWTPAEDAMLRQLSNETVGPNKDWEHISRSIPGRTPMSCKKRWHDHLSPAVLHDPFTPEEDRVILWAHANIGRKWARIARSLIGRTGNSVRNNWRYQMRRKYSSMTNIELENFMNAGQFGAVFVPFVNPFNPNEPDARDVGVDDPLTALTLATPGH